MVYNTALYKLNAYVHTLQLLYNTSYSWGLYFRVNSQVHREVKIKSSPIIYCLMIIEQERSYREKRSREYFQGGGLVKIRSRKK